VKGNVKRQKKKKTIPVAGRGGPYGCETLSHFLDNRLTDGGEVVSLGLRKLKKKRGEMFRRHEEFGLGGRIN
jgi:hypothetical protein